MRSDLEDGVPCDHRGCLNHVTHPCEGCGRVGGKFDLQAYIAQRKYHCPYCIELQKRVVKNGLQEIKKWGGMICSSVEDMQIRLEEVETGVKFVPVDLSDLW